MEASLHLLKIIEPRLKSDNANYIALLNKAVALFLIAALLAGGEMDEAFQGLEGVFDALIKSGNVIGGSGFGRHEQKKRWKGKQELAVNELVIG